MIFVILITQVGMVRSQSIQELQKEKENTRQQIELTKSLLEQTSQKKRQNLARLNIIQKNIDLRKKLISNINLELAILDDEMEQKEIRVAELNNELEREIKNYETIIIQAYKEKKGYHPLVYIFSSRSFNQAYKRIKYLQQIAEYRKNQVERIRKIRKELLQEISDIEQKKKEKNELLEEQKKESDDLKNSMGSQQEMIAQLARQEKELRAKLAEKEKTARNLENTIRALIEAEAKKNAGRTIRLTPEQQLIDKDFRNNKGRLPWPTERGIITGYFGEHAHPVLKGVKISSNGIDITTTAGSEARAVFDGEVSMVASVPGANKVVIIRHGNYLSMYSNLVEVYVKSGDKVKVKQKIGRIFTDTEEEGKTVVHLEIWEESQKLDPMQWLSKE